MKFGIARRKFGRLILAAMLIGMASWGVYRIIDVAFALENIEVISTEVAVIVDESRISKNLLFFPADSLRAEILKNNPLLSDVQFTKVFPHTIRIIPVLRTPFVRLRATDRTVLIDREGVVLTDGDGGKTLPLLAVPVAPFRVGEKLSDPRVATALFFFTGGQETIPVSSIYWIGDGAYLQAKSGKTDIFIPQDTSPGEVLATLQTLMTGFRIKGTLPTVVDLRFDKPVVTF